MRDVTPHHLGGPAPLLLTYATDGTYLAAWADAGWLARRWRLIESQRAARRERRDPMEEAVRLVVDEPGLMVMERPVVRDAATLRSAARHLGTSMRWHMIPREHVPADVTLHRATARFCVEPSGNYFRFEGELEDGPSQATFQSPGTDAREICLMQLRVVPDADVAGVLANLAHESALYAGEVLLGGVPVPGTDRTRELLPLAGPEALAIVLEQAPDRVRERLITRLSALQPAPPPRTVRR